ncbi:hypothetical protein AB3N02_22555 [Priestia aryabhattai]|uniref:hypothetical protein n=1 Tax=Priestia aryabhattai TaxID=412384 RepID=UPI0039A303F9
MAKKQKQVQTASNGFYFESEAEAIRVLKAEGKRLERIARRVWQRYLDSYEPKKYAEHINGMPGHRTGRSMKSIKLGRVKRIGDNEYGIELTFINDLVYHESVFGNAQPEGHSIMLISSGWTARKLEEKIGIREHFTRYKGFNYLGEVQRAFNNGKHKGIDLEIQWSGKYLK